MQITREEGLSGESVNEIAISDNGFAWIATSRDHYSYDTKRQKISNYNLSTLSPADIDLRYVAVRKSKVFLGSKNHGLFIYDLKKNTFRRVSDITIYDPLIDVEKAKENYGITVVHSLPSNKSYDVIAVTTAHDIFSRDAFLHIEHKPIMHLCEKVTE